MMRLLQGLSLADSSDNSRLSCGLVLLLILLVIMGVPHLSWAARWYEDYERAVALIDEGGCSREALQLLGAAVVDKPRPRLNARTIAVQTIDYLPYYQLARAHLACGDVESARHYLETSRERGVAPVELLESLDRTISQAESEVSQRVEGGIDPEVLANRVREVNEIIRQARLLAAQIESREGRERFTALFQSQASDLEVAEGNLRNAEEFVAEGSLKRDATLIGSASKAASAALETYSNFETRLVSLERASPTRTPTSIPQTFAATPTPVRTPAAPQPTRTDGPGVPIPVPTATVGLSEPVPAALRRAVAEYLQGNYEVVARNLVPGDFSTPRERAAAYLLRAAARYALFSIDGRTSENSLERVRADLVLCRASDDSLQPDTTIFSPEFVQLFRSVVR
jgi:hypothetical protein